MVWFFGLLAAGGPVGAKSAGMSSGGSSTNQDKNGGCYGASKWQLGLMDYSVVPVLMILFFHG